MHGPWWACLYHSNPFITCWFHPVLLVLVLLEREVAVLAASLLNTSEQPALWSLSSNTEVETWTLWLLFCFKCCYYSASFLSHHQGTLFSWFFFSFETIYVLLRMSVSDFFCGMSTIFSNEGWLSSLRFLSCVTIKICFILDNFLQLFYIITFQKKSQVK